jgi:hypothetical protein
VQTAAGSHSTRHDSLAELATERRVPTTNSPACSSGSHFRLLLMFPRQVSTMFVPLAREGWLQKLVASPGRPFGAWRVLWVELLEDGKLSWFDSARKRKSDFRQAF